MQQAIGLLLVAVCGLAGGYLLFKLAFVAYALIAAALRYSIVAVLLLLLAIVLS